MNPAPPTDRFLERAGARLRYRDQGSGPVVVMVHGWALDLRAWDLIVDQLSRGFRLLRFDRRGFGGSGGIPGIGADAADALALLDGLGIAHAAVIGHSQGARVALDLVRQAGHRVDCLVLDGCPALPGLPGEWSVETPLEHYRALLRGAGPARLRAELAAHPLFRLRSRDRAMHALLRDMLEQYQGGDLLSAPAMAPAAEPRLDRMGLPVLIVNGEFDTPQRLAVGAALKAILPDARRQLIPEAGHLACMDNPASYARSVSEFLRHHAGQSQAHSPEAS